MGGVTRGSCKPTDGDAKTLREKHPESHYTVKNVKWGAIGSTNPDGPAPAPTPTPTPSDCPGGSLDACIDLCPPDAFKACVESCQRRCGGPVPPSPSPTPAPTPSSECRTWDGKYCGATSAYCKATASQCADCGGTWCTDCLPPFTTAAPMTV